MVKKLIALSLILSVSRLVAHDEVPVVDVVVTTTEQQTVVEQSVPAFEEEVVELDEHGNPIKKNPALCPNKQAGAECCDCNKQGN